MPFKIEFTACTNGKRDSIRETFRRYGEQENIATTLVRQEEFIGHFNYLLADFAVPANSDCFR